VASSLDLRDDVLSEEKISIINELLRMHVTLV